MTASPQTTDATLDRRVATLLQWLLSLCLGVGIVYVVVGIVWDRFLTESINAVIALAGFAVGLWLLRRGRIQLASLVAALTLFAAATLEAIAFGSATHFTPLLPIYALALAFPALVLGWREAVITTVVEIAGLSVLALLESTGRLGAHADLEHISAARMVFFGAAYLSVFGGFLAGAARTYRRTIQQLERARSSLSDTEARMSQLIREMPDGLVSLDGQGVVVECNPAAARIAGLRVDQMVGRHFSALSTIASPLDAEAHLAALRDGTSTAPPLTVVAVTRDDGSTIHIEANPRVVQRGDDVRVQVVIRDVTARTRIERERAALQQQLREARRLEAVGRLAGGIAHDFNNLLTVIVSGADMLRDSDLDAGSRDLVEQVDTAAHRAADLTGQLLAFARRQVRKPRVIDLNGTVKELQALLPRLVRENIEIQLDTTDHVLPVWADPTQLHQVMVNLVVNARDAMPTGGALRLHTSDREVLPDDPVVRQGVAPGSWVVFAVTDTGTGIDDETRAHIFEPFYTTKGSDGTGLGLATVHGIVVQTGGTVVVHSEPDRGTTFEVYLPRTERDAHPSAAPPPGRRAGQGRTILVVDDEDLVRDTIERVLQHDGYRVLAAGHPERALELAEQSGEIDLLITDVVLPQLGGHELAQRLKRGRDDLRVLYTSGYTESAVIRHGVADDVLHFLPKPFTPDALRRKLAEVLGG